MAARRPIVHVNGETHELPLGDSVVGPVWGGVTGTLSAQTDLQGALNGKQAADVTLDALAAFSTNGLICRIGADAFAGRTLTETANEISIGNPGGIGGNPIFSIPADFRPPNFITLRNTGLRLVDTSDAPGTSNYLNIRVGEALTANRLFSIITGDAARTLNLSAGNFAPSAYGLSLIDDADATAARATLGLSNAELTTNKGAANGYAPLDGTGKVASAYLPSFVDDVLEYANLAGFPGTGAAGVLYVDLATNKVYRWSGSAYVEISGSPGSTDAVTEGATNLYFTVARVLATVLTGFSTASSAVVTAADTILAALGKLQAQVTARLVASNNLSDIGNAGTARANLGLGTLATQSGTFSGTSSGANSGDQTITLTGNVTGSGTGSFATTIAAGVVVNSMLANVATATLKGRATAGSGVVEDLTAAQATALLNTFTSALKGLVPASGGGTTNFLRADGTWASTSGVSVDPLDLAATGVAAPAAGTVRLFRKDLAGRQMPAFIGPSGMAATVQPFFATNKIARWNPSGNVTTVPNIDGFTAAFTALGTATARNVATTNFITRLRRFGYVSAATAAAFCGHYGTVAQWTIGDGAGLGGFYYNCRFVPSDAAAVAGARMFVGLRNAVSAPTNVEPNTLTNCVGVAQLSSSTNLQMVYAGSAAQTAIDLGAGFPASGASSAAYELELFASPGNQTIGYKVTRLDNGTVASGTLSGVVGTAVPAATTFLAHTAWRTNNATLLACGLDVVQVYLETDN